MTKYLGLAGLLSSMAIASPLAPCGTNVWSSSMSGISGRLCIAEQSISEDAFFTVALELRNDGAMPLAVQCANPHLFTAAVIDGAGKRVQPTLARHDVISSPQWGVIPGNSYLRFPVSIQSEDGAKGSHLDTTTLIWKLAPGMYRISADYSSGKSADFMGQSGPATIWTGTLRLPQVNIEVTPKK